LMLKGKATNLGCASLARATETALLGTFCRHELPRDQPVKQAGKTLFDSCVEVWLKPDTPSRNELGTT